MILHPPTLRWGTLESFFFSWEKRISKANVWACSLRDCIWLVSETKRGHSPLPIIDVMSYHMTLYMYMYIHHISLQLCDLSQHQLWVPSKLCVLLGDTQRGSHSNQRGWSQRQVPSGRECRWQQQSRAECSVNQDEVTFHLGSEQGKEISSSSSHTNDI